jgi:hypothetical protein
MAMWVAKETFFDASDGSMIQKGISRVSPEADVFKRFPDRFELVRSSPGAASVITRPGPVMSFGKPAGQRRRKQGPAEYAAHYLEPAPVLAAGDE